MHTPRATSADTLVAPRSLNDALEVLSANPELTVLAGGTDLMVAMNYGLLRPSGVLSLRRVEELRQWRQLDDGRLWLGAAITYRQLQEAPLAGLVPGLAQASRTVGSPQIRNTGTLGGNLGTASPAGDTLPVLASLGAEVILRSTTAQRVLPLIDGEEPFIVGPKRTARRPDELIEAVIVPVLRGPQEFLKIGTRNALVIAVASCALVVDLDHGRLRATLGSVGPVPMRCAAAEAWVTEQIDWVSAGAGERAVTDPRTYETFGAKCADASAPIDDHRSTAAYRRHACAVITRRALMRCL